MHWRITSKLRPLLVGGPAAHYSLASEEDSKRLKISSNSGLFSGSRWKQSCMISARMGGEPSGGVKWRSSWQTTSTVCIMLNSGKGSSPRVIISQRVTPNAHTSDLLENTLDERLSGAIHLIGPTSVVVTSLDSSNALDIPKSGCNVMSDPRKTQTNLREN